MSERGPIIVIEDDEDDREFYSETLNKLPIENEVIFFSGADSLVVKAFLSFFLQQVVIRIQL